MAKVFIFMSHLQVVSGGVLNTALNEKIKIWPWEYIQRSALKMPEETEMQRKSFYHKVLILQKSGKKKKHGIKLNILNPKEYRLFVLRLTVKLKYGKVPIPCG